MALRQIPANSGKLPSYATMNLAWSIVENAPLGILKAA
jgi:hypothetical protein